MSTLTGRIVHPTDANYTKASTGWDELFTHYPLVIVFAQQTEDVMNALTWARQNDVAVRVRSGRHSLEGWSNVDNGIVIDVSELKGVHVVGQPVVKRVEGLCVQTLERDITEDRVDPYLDQPFVTLERGG